MICPQVKYWLLEQQMSWARTQNHSNWTEPLWTLWTTELNPTPALPTQILQGNFELQIHFCNLFKQGCVNIYKRSTQGMFWTNCDKSVPQSTPTALKYIIILLRQILVYFLDKYWSTWPPGNVLEIAAKCPGKLLLYSPELNAVWGNSHSDLALFQKK